MLFSQNYACPEHGSSIDELTPRMFSFNNPLRRLRDSARASALLCKVDPALILPNKKLSIREGAIKASGLVLCGRFCQRDVLQGPWAKNTVLRWTPKSRTCRQRRRACAFVRHRRRKAGDDARDGPGHRALYAPTSKASSTIWSAASAKPIPSG